MYPDVSTSVHFIGGPFDGHVQPISCPTHVLNDEVTLPVNENILNWVNGGRRGPRRRATSLAVYELESVGGTCTYRFLKPMAPADQPQYTWMC